MTAVVVRFWALDIKPAHFDEGVNGWFADQMLRTGYYNYDPTNYHGPLHFYTVFLSQNFLGRNLWALRLPAVLASIACVWLLLRFHPFFGRAACRVAALAMAVSPAFVFYGRYSIHESSFVLFAMLATWGGIALWLQGTRGGLWALCAGVAGMILTKETYIIQLGSMILALLTLLLWQRVFPSSGDQEPSRQRWKWSDLGLGVGVSLFVILAFYSGFFLNWQGVGGLMTSLFSWAETGVDPDAHAKTGHQIGYFNYYWLDLMVRYEWPALLGLFACTFYILGGVGRTRYLAILGGGLLVAYSIIPYKTPWCIIAFLWPFYLVLGAALQQWRPVPGALLAAVALGGSTFQMLRLNFVRYTDDREPYVYVQTYEEIAHFTDPLFQRVYWDPSTLHLPAQILLESYYPIPWILGDFTNVGYYQSGSWPEELSGAFVAVERDKEEEVLPRLAAEYIRVPFRLRSAHEFCVAFFRRDLFEGMVTGEIVGGNE